MQYMLMIYEDESFYGSEEGAEALGNIISAHQELAGSLGDKLVSGAGLKSPDTATTLRVSGQARTLHDGPFAESREQLGGFYVVDVPDLDAAIEIARKIPFGRDGSVEIRPVLDEDGRPS